MTLDQFRQEMEAYRLAVHEEAIGLKDPNLALERLYALYQRFDAEERSKADQVIAEWVLSENSSTRFCAQALIREFGIATAIPALDRLARRLASSLSPGASAELDKVNPIIKKLASSQAQQRNDL